MPNRAVLTFIALPLLLGACAPVASLLANRDAEGPAPRRAGPLVVGQTWTVSGTVDTRNVTATVGVPDLVDTPGNLSATANARDQIAAFETGRSGFTLAEYDPNRRVLSFRWIGESPDVTYTCTVDYAFAVSPVGVLLYQRGGRTVANGTCQAVLSQSAG